MRRTTEKDHPFNLCLPPESFYVGANIVKSFLQKPTPKYKITPRGWMVDGTDSSKRVLTQSNTQVLRCPHVIGIACMDQVHSTLLDLGHAQDKYQTIAW